MNNDWLPRTSITDFVKIARVSGAPGELDKTILHTAYKVNYTRWSALLTDSDIIEGFYAACTNYKEEQLMDDFMYELQQEMLQEQAQRILYTTNTGTPYQMDAKLIIIERGRKGTYMWGTEHQIFNCNGRYILKEQKGNKDELLKGIDTIIADEFDSIQRYDGDTPDARAVGNEIAQNFVKSNKQAIQAYAEMKAFIKGHL